MNLYRCSPLNKIDGVPIKIGGLYTVKNDNSGILFYMPMDFHEDSVVKYAYMFINKQFVIHTINTDKKFFIIKKVKDDLFKGQIMVSFDEAVCMFVNYDKLKDGSEGKICHLSDNWYNLHIRICVITAASFMPTPILSYTGVRIIDLNKWPSGVLSYVITKDPNRLKLSGKLSALHIKELTKDGINAFHGRKYYGGYEL